jgi:cytochrome b561
MDDRNAGAAPVLAAARYDRATILLHWLIAILVVVLMATALVWNYVTPRDRTWRPILESAHVSLGILFAVALLVRIVWRLAGARWLPPEQGLSGYLSRVMYLVLYVLMAAVTVDGFVLRWYQGETFTFFGLFDMPALLARDRPTAGLWEQAHNVMAWAIVILAGGHSIAALWHRYVMRDHVLGRMLWGRGRTG